MNLDATSDKTPIMPNQDMAFQLQPATDLITIAEIGPALDFRNASAFKEVCMQEVEKGVRFFVLDFSDTGILDSTGLGTIFYLHRQLKPTGGRVVFAAPSRPVQVVVQLTRAFKHFQQFVTIEEALERLQMHSRMAVGPILTQYKAQFTKEV